MRAHTFGRWVGRIAWTQHSLMALGSSLLLAATGCLTYPNSDERYNEEIVYSRYDSNADFQEFKTFAINPEVTVFSEDDGDVEREPLDEDLAEDIVAKVVENLKDRGYTQVEPSDNPDLGLTVSVLSGTVTAYYSSYWGSYWGYPYYYYYYPYYSSYSYNTGTLIVDTVDLKNAPPAGGDAGVGDAGVSDAGVSDAGAGPGHLGVIWSGLVYGVLSTSTNENMQDALRGIDQAFKQSPYFRSE